MKSRGMWIAACGVLIAGGCGDDEQERRPDVQDEAVIGTACNPPPAYSEELAACVPLGTDYTPREAASANDTWPACISDDGVFHPIESGASTIGRIDAFESIAALLWGSTPPTSDDFIAAYDAYLTPEGLDSRLVRRYDIHYAAPAGGAKCEDSAEIASANPDYCVGPAVLHPVLTDAFATGAAGRDRLVSAARVQAALVWFLYTSVLKEARTCTGTPRDCDSSWAYYTGGGDRAAPRGLGAMIQALSAETHDRAYDGLLAVRCWKDLDNPAGTSTNTALRDQAIAQVDVALLRGVALLTRQRFAELACTSGHHREAAHAWLRVVVPLLDRSARERDPTLADVLATEVAKDAASVDHATAIAAIDALYECP